MNITAGTLIGQGLTFLVFIVVTMKFVWPNLMAMMEQRRQQIADGLAAGEEAVKKLDAAAVEAEQVIQQAREQAAQIREQASQQAAQLKEQAKADAQAERERQVAATQAEIEQAANRAREALAAQVARLAVIGAEQLLQREVDAKAHQELLDKLAAEI